jgi:hypothetical protein
MKNGPTFTNAGPQSSQQIESQQTSFCSELESASTTKNQSGRPPTKRRRRAKTSARTALSPGRRELSVYDGTNLVGIIKIAPDGKSAALNAFGKRLGVFPSQQAASAALNKLAAGGRR